MTALLRKKWFRIGILFFLFLATAFAAFLCRVPSALAQTGTGVEVSYLTRSDALLQQRYLDRYGIFANSDKEEYILSYSMNGGNYGTNLPEKAFDGNFDTFWETGTVNSADFRNQISVEFNREVRIDRILFATRRDGQWQKGFPLTATFSVSDDGTNYETAGVGVAEVKNNVVLYSFSEPFSARYFRFEYTDVYAGMTQHASASELIFLRPEEEIVGTVRHLFSDYMNTQLLPQYNDRQTILALKQQLEGHPLYEGDLEKYLDRALSVLDGTLLTDPVNRQFTTDPDGRGKFLQQRGDIAGYGQDLHFMFGLSNYMPTGIFGNTGEQITVYVEADEGQPLPMVVFTQFLTTYQYWQGGKIQLKRGENVLTVPAFTHTASYTNAGGPIYLVNPYTAAQQNTGVKVYIEGGHTYPVFYEGGSEEKFRNDLIDYAEYYAAHSDTAFNIAEVMSDHILVTAQATRAKEIYVDDGVSAQTVCENWDEYMRALLRFNGVTFDPGDEHYDARVEKLYLNVRVMQPFSSAADAYATGQHVGIRINTGWETVALSGSGFGWGTSHEIGHIIEIGEYRVLEYTNNMVSNFNETVLDGLPSRGNHDKITQLLAPDSVLGSDGIASGGSYDNTYVVWWNIESVFPGYWGKYNNLFRYGVPQGYPSADGMSAVEKQVYYSSIATGLDTGYYFDRYGYRFNNSRFTLDGASAAYQNAVSSLIAQGKLSEKQPKFWYVGADTGTLTYRYGDKLAAYDAQMTVSPLYIGKENNGYRINLPDSSGTFGHLGYEIIENGKVIGFTTSSTYFGGTSYGEGYVPRYQIRAYDQRLNATAACDVWTFGAQTGVARIGTREFSSLADALAATREGDVIVLLADIPEENLTVDKSVTVTNDGRPVHILKIGEQNIFNVAAGVTLTMKGSADAPIVIDGSNVARAGKGFVSAGSLDLQYLCFQNLNGTSPDGTAICLEGQAGSLRLYGCSFTAIQGTGRGGAVYVPAGSGPVRIEQCTFTDNATSGAFNGGALFLGAVSTIIRSDFIGNKAARNSGGALYLSGADSFLESCVFRGNYADALDGKGGGALFLDAYCTAEKCTFTGNSAFTGANGGNGGAVYAGAGGATFVSCDFTGNSACTAGVCYISSGNVLFRDCDLSGNRATAKAGAVWVNWSYGAVSANFDGCTVTGNTSAGDGTIYINYYEFPNQTGLGQSLLSFTNSVFKDNASANANLHMNGSWLRLNAEGSTIVGSVNQKVDLRSGYENLRITLLADTGTDGEIVRRSSSPMEDDVLDHFFLSDALALKYRLELGETGNSLWLRQLQFKVTTEVNGEIFSDDALYTYGENFTLPDAPDADEGFTFRGWLYGDALLQPGETVSLVSGGKITAVFEQHLFRLRLVYSDGESLTEKTYRAGDVIHVSDLASPAENFAGWQYKGAVYFPGDKILFDGKNVTFLALYSAPGQPDTPGGDADSDQSDSGQTGGGESDPPGQSSQPGKSNSLLIAALSVAAVAAAAAVIVFFVVRRQKPKRK